MTKETALMLLNNQLRKSHFKFTTSEQDIWHEDKKYTFKELLKIAYDLK